MSELCCTQTLWGWQNGTKYQFLYHNFAKICLLRIAGCYESFIRADKTGFSAVLAVIFFKAVSDQIWSEYFVLLK